MHTCSYTAVISIFLDCKQEITMSAKPVHFFKKSTVNVVNGDLQNCSSSLCAFFG